MSLRQKTILDFVRTADWPVTISDVQRHTGFAKDTVMSWLGRLEQSGEIESQPIGASRGYRIKNMEASHR